MCFVRANTLLEKSAISELVTWSLDVKVPLWNRKLTFSMARARVRVFEVEAHDNVFHDNIFLPEVHEFAGCWDNFPDTSPVAVSDAHDCGMAHVPPALR